MALTAYDQMQQTVRRYCWDRDDLAGMIPDWITLCESRLNNLLLVQEMEATSTVTLTAGVGALPTDYLAWRRVLTTDSPVRTLEWAEPGWAEDAYEPLVSGLANHFTIIGTQIKTYPLSAANLTFSYYQKIPPLASNMTGNWVTQNHPQLYIYGCMLEATPFLDDDDRLGNWGQLFNDAAQKVLNSDLTGRYARPIMRVKGITP